MSVSSLVDAASVVTSFSLSLSFSFWKQKLGFDEIVDRPVRNDYQKLFSANRYASVWSCPLLSYLWDIKQATQEIASVKGGWLERPKTIVSPSSISKQTNKCRKSAHTKQKQKDEHTGDARNRLATTTNPEKKIVGENPKHVFNHLWQLGREINIQLGVLNDRPLSIEKGPMPRRMRTRRCTQIKRNEDNWSTVLVITRHHFDRRWSCRNVWMEIFCVANLFIIIALMSLKLHARAHFVYCLVFLLFVERSTIQYSNWCS